MTTSDFDRDNIVPTDDDFALDVEAPVADSLEQRVTADGDEPGGNDLPTELPDDVNPADALEQSLSVGDQDDDV